MSLAELPDWRAGVRGWGKRLVVTNGCFDVIHAGHISYLRQAKRAGDILLVGLNSDASIRALKGPQRPVNHQADRITVLSELESVDAIAVFENVRATDFLAIAMPDVYIKGGDYTLEKMDPNERLVLASAHAEILFIDLLPGRSTTAIIARG